MLPAIAFRRAAKPAISSQEFLKNPILKGFAVRVTANGVRCFTVEKRIGGGVKRTTLVRYPELTAEQACPEGPRLLG